MRHMAIHGAYGAVFWVLFLSKARIFVNQSPIFLKYYDLMLWLIPHMLTFPKSQRGVLAKQLQHELFSNYELLVDAGKSEHPLQTLNDIDKGLIRLRTYLKLSYELKVFSVGQYEHVSRLIAEIGRLLGAWIKSVQHS